MVPPVAAHDGVKEVYMAHFGMLAGWASHLVGDPDPDIAAPGPDHAQVMSVRAAVELLPDRQRMAVLLHYFADLTVTQVARELGRAEGTVKRDLYDARARLAPILEGAR